MKTKAIFKAALISLGISFLLKPNMVFAADNEKLVDVYLQAVVYDENNDKIFIKSNDAIFISSSDGKNIDFTLENGEIKAMLPLYELDNDCTEKKVRIDNNIHTALIQNGDIEINPDSWMFKAKYDGEPTDVFMDSYTIEIPYEGTVEWTLSRDIEQSYEVDDKTIKINVAGKDLYSGVEYEPTYGDSSIVRYEQPCNYRNANSESDDRGYYTIFKTESPEISSLAKGEVISVDDVGNAVAIKHNDGLLAVYENITPCVSVGYEVKKGELIGNALNNDFVLRVCDNGTWMASEWLYDRFERPEEGINMPRMYQTDSEWGNRTYGYSTIAGGGCGPSAMAMAASALTGKVYTPEDIVTIIESCGESIWYYVAGVGSTYTIFPKVCEKLGLQCEATIDASEESLRSYLEDGKIVIISIAAGRYYHGDGHFIVLRGLSENGKFLINDSASVFDLNSEYDYSDFTPINSARAIWN